MSAGQARAVLEGDLQIVSVNNDAKAVAAAALPPRPPSDGNNALVEYRPIFKEEEEDLEVKLRRIIDNVPVRVSNTSGSSAGSGSGDFHQVCSVSSFSETLVFIFWGFVCLWLRNVNITSCLCLFRCGL